jgi:hypothetical protein
MIFLNFIFIDAAHFWGTLLFMVIFSLCLTVFVKSVIESLKRSNQCPK